MRDGHDTIQDARTAWFTHCDEQRGKDHPADFTPTWPDDVLQAEPPAAGAAGAAGEAGQPSTHSRPEA
jgi:hypothetical protein